MILWPAESEFPQRVVTDGYQFSFAEGRINSPMSRGFAKTRGNALGAPRAIPCHLMLPTALLARLERFWNEDTQGGNLWFVIPDQTFDNEQLVDEFGYFIFDEFGGPVTQTSYWLARFSGGGLSVSSVTPNDWNVGFALDVRVL